MTTTVAARLWAIADGIFLAMFVIAVAVQFNDPDPIRWITIYGLAAIGCSLSLAGRGGRRFPGAVAAIAFAWAATIAPRVIGRVPFEAMFGAWEMKNSGVEESREMYGLLLVAIWMMVLALRAKPRLTQRP